MKKGKIVFISFVVFCFFSTSCTQKKRNHRSSESSVPAKSVSERKRDESRDSLFFMEGENLAFFMTGSSIESVKIIGILHNDGYDKALADKEEAQFDAFFDLYFSATKKNPSEFALAVENCTRPGEDQVGTTWLLKQSFSFVTPHLFERGVRKIIKADRRDKSPESLKRYKKSFELFDERGGYAEIVPGNNFGFPVAKILQEPKFTEADLAWLRDEWFPKCYLPDRDFEENVTRFAERGIVCAVGCAHAMRIFKKSGIQIALIAPPGYIEAVSLTLAQNEYFLKVLSKTEKI